jgi:hypothetical protein
MMLIGDYLVARSVASRETAPRLEFITVQVDRHIDRKSGIIIIAPDAADVGSLFQNNEIVQTGALEMTSSTDP